jgi:predicted transcriptional regulator
MNKSYNFAPWMIADLKKSGISIKTAQAYGMYPANDKQNYIIPYIEPESKKPMLDTTGKPYIRRKMFSGKIKYQANKDSGIRCYIPKKTHKYYINNPKTPLLITEGEKKAIAATENGLFTIGLCGITMWRSKSGSNKVHPDLLKYFKGRKEVYFIYDSDGKNKKNFQRNSEVFAKALKKYGIKLYIIFLPQFGIEKTGLDDFLLRFSKKELYHYVETSKEQIKPKFKTNTYGRVYFDDLHKHKLKPNDYLLLTMTKGLAKKKGYCTASRQYLANCLDVTRQTIINKLQKLQKRDLIYIKNVSGREKPFKLTAKGVCIIEKGGSVEVATV